MKAFRRLGVWLMLGLCLSLLIIGIAEAADLTLEIRSVDADQFPKVSATVSLVDSLNIPFAKLDPSALTVTEDGKPVDSVQIEPSIDPQQSFAVALLVDADSSMNDAGKLDVTKKALGTFIDALGPQDTVALLSYSDQVKVVQGYTSDKTALKAAVNTLSANGPAAIYDAVGQAAQLQGALPQQRKVLLVLADGGDTASKQTMDQASAAAQDAHVPIYAVGLGSGVHHDILDVLAGRTGGQVTYATSNDQLTPAFQDLATHFRRLYILTYTSKLSADNKPHTLAITVKERVQRLNQQGTWVGHDATVSQQGTFTAKSNALDFTVSGIKTATQVSGTTPITVTLNSGAVTSMQLLVDGQQRASVASAPYVFPWDTTKETPGIHRVVVRAMSADGSHTDTEFIIQVLPPAVPTVAPAPSPAEIAPTATPAPAPAQSSSLPYIIGGLALLAIVGGIVAFLLTRPRPKVPAVSIPQTPPPPARRVMEDKTDLIPVADSNLTAVSGETVALATPAVRLPKARLVLAEKGAEREIALTQPDTTVGRDPGNPVVVSDPQASRRHARIFLDNGDFWVEDLKSRNGTRVNGEIATRQKLKSGDQIGVGDSILTFIPEPN